MGVKKNTKDKTWERAGRRGREKLRVILPEAHAGPFTAEQEEIHRAVTYLSPYGLFTLV